MIQQILYKDIPRDIYRRGFHLTFPSGDKSIYFKLDKDLSDVELCQVLRSLKMLPDGIIHIEALGQYNYFRVQYYPEEITEERILFFVNNIKFK